MSNGKEVIFCRSTPDIADRKVLTVEEMQKMTNEEIQQLHALPLDHEDGKLVPLEECKKCPHNPSCEEYKRGSRLTLHTGKQK